MARKCTSALSRPRSDVAERPVRYQYWIEGTCGTAWTLYSPLSSRWSLGTSWITCSGSTSSITLLPVGPRPVSPEVVHIEKTALEQVGAQAFDLLAVESDRPHIRHEDEGAAEDLVVLQGYDRVKGLSVLGTADRGGGELRKAQREVGVGVGIIRAPALAQPLAAHAAVGNAAEGEAELGRLARAGHGSASRVAASPSLRARGTRGDRQGARPEHGQDDTRPGGPPQSPLLHQKRDDISQISALAHDSMRSARTSSASASLPWARSACSSPTSDQPLCG